ncbi:unnamed protein product [Polarella glacialis]|uniref:Pseudouridine synthase RsuA/RluA-like domain-containing protein n=1 Tax=Polarella glacialis TaxID=89957 RepID=A0A813J923_POLGL|nr:unnamed protein product [Polarella glacialis]
MPEGHASLSGEIHGSKSGGHDFQDSDDLVRQFWHLAKKKEGGASPLSPRASGGQRSSGPGIGNGNRAVEPTERSAMESLALRLETFAAEGKLGAKSLGNVMMATRYFTRHPMLDSLLLASAKAFRSSLADASAQDLANSAWALAKASRVDEKTMDAIAEESLRKMSGFQVLDLCKCAWAFATFKLKPTQLYPALSAESFRKRSQFMNSPRDLVGLVWSFAKVAAREAQLEKLVEQGVLQMFHQFKAQDIANTLWSIAKLDFGSALVSTLANCPACQELGKFSPQHLSNIAWAMGQLQGDRCRSPCLELLQTVATHLVTAGRVVELSPQGISNTLWALAATELCDHAVLTALAHEADKKLQHFQPQELANIAWAVARLKLQEERTLVLNIGQWSSAKVQNFKSQELCNLAWALATLGLQDSQHFYSIVEAAVEGGESLKPQECCNLLWSIAKADGKNDGKTGGRIRPGSFSTGSESFGTESSLDEAFGRRLSRGILEKLIKDDSSLSLSEGGGTAPSFEDGIFLEDTRSSGSKVFLDAFSPRDVANLAWAMATLEQDNTRLLCRLAEVGVQKAGDFAAQDISNVMWAFAALAIKGTELLHVFAIEARMRIQSFKPQELSILAWSYATLDAQESELFKAIQQSAVGRLSDFSAQDISNLLWSFSRCGFPELQLVNAIADGIVVKLGQGLANREKEKRLLQKVRSDSDADSKETEETSRSSSFDEGGHSGLFSKPCSKELDLQEPFVLLDLDDRMVIQKPPGWEVNQDCYLPAVDENRPPRMSAFLQALLPARRWPIFLDASCHFGLVHRIDVPCSGLLLAAKTYVAYYDLQFQLNAGRLIRDYCVLCHGWAPSGPRSIDARIHWDPGKPKAPGSVQGRGKPSLTCFKTLAHARKRGDFPSPGGSGSGESFSFVVLRIQTGRRHQIRIHTAYIGHPLAGDSRYLSKATFASDLSWCSCICLHRYRLAFESSARDVGSGAPVGEATKGAEERQPFSASASSFSLPPSHHEAVASLPPELIRALRELEPRGSDSAQVLSAWSDTEEHQSADAAAELQKPGQLQDWSLLKPLGSRTRPPSTS